MPFDSAVSLFPLLLSGEAKLVLQHPISLDGIRPYLPKSTANLHFLVEPSKEKIKELLCRPPSGSAHLVYFGSVGKYEPFFDGIPCDLFKIADKAMIPSPTGFMFPKKSKIGGKLQSLMQTIFQESQWTRYLLSKYQRARKVSGKPKVASGQDSASKQVKLKYLRKIFFGFSMFQGVSILVFLCEILNYRVIKS